MFGSPSKAGAHVAFCSLRCTNTAALGQGLHPWGQLEAFHSLPSASERLCSSSYGWQQVQQGCRPWVVKNEVEVMLAVSRPSSRLFSCSDRAVLPQETACYVLHLAKFLTCWHFSSVAPSQVL